MLTYFDVVEHLITSLCGSRIGIFGAHGEHPAPLRDIDLQDIDLQEQNKE